MIVPGVRIFPLPALLAVLIATMCGGGRLAAQPSFSFRMGTATLLVDDLPYTGFSVGSVGKFDVIPYLRFRMQLDVDKIRMNNVEAENLHGDQSVTFICAGLGVETAVGNPDFYFFANLTPHGTLRTTLHKAVSESGETVISDVARFSLGLVGGIGGDVFIMDRLGLEGMMQYDIYNVDPYTDEPVYKGVRITVGLQFYLGTNYKR